LRLLKRFKRKGGSASNHCSDDCGQSSDFYNLVHKLFVFWKIAFDFDDLIIINKPRINKIVEVAAETIQ